MKKSSNYKQTSFVFGGFVTISAGHMQPRTKTPDMSESMQARTLPLRQQNPVMSKRSVNSGKKKKIDPRMDWESENPVKNQ